MSASFFRCFGLLLVLLLTNSAWADAPPKIVDSPMTLPEALAKQMETPHLPSTASESSLRYMAGQDATRIENWLRSEGYLDAKVHVEIRYHLATWYVVAGPLWTIRHVHVLPLPSSQLILPKFGDVFSSTRYEQSKAAALLFWQQQGYLQATFLRATVTPIHASHQVDIDWDIVPAGLFYISEIRTEGAQQYPAELAVRISRLKLGDVVTQKALQDAMQRIADDSHYQLAVVEPQLAEATGDGVPIRMALTESGWRKLTGDANYSTDMGLGFSAGWVDRGLMDGWAEYALRGELSPTISGVGATLLRSAWPLDDEKVGMNIDFSHVKTVGRIYSSTSGGPFWQWDFRRKDYLRLSLQGENVFEAGINVLTLGPRVDIHFFQEQRVSWKRAGWRLDASVSVPNRVHRVGLWTLLDISSRLFYQPFHNLMISPRLGYGRTVNLQGVVPKTYKQFVGGANSVRGFAVDSLGPRGNDGLAIGGLMKMYAGVDVMFWPEAALFSPVLFWDGAALWQRVGGAPSSARSVGLGEVIHTPAGSLRMDLAFPIQRRAQDAAFQFYMTLGELF